MAPPKLNQKTQLSMYHFTKRNALVPDATQPANQHPKQPLRPMPRPTAPPFFKQPMPKPPLPRHATTIADDAWEVADRLMKGHRLTPQKRAFDDDAPVVDDSDDDFEPDVVTQRTPGASSSARKSASALRDDRGSMTKRSATKSKRAEPLGYIPTQQRSVFDDFGTPPKMPSLCSSEDDDDRVVVFDGEKSSLSGTDNEDERGVDELDLDTDIVEPPPSEQHKGNASPRQREEGLQLDVESGEERSADNANIDIVSPVPVRRQKDIRHPFNRQGHSPSSKIVIPAQTSRSRRSDAKLASPKCPSKPPKDISPFLEKDSPIPPASRGRAPRTIGLRKCSTGADDMFQASPAEQGARRKRKIRPLFNSDSDEFDSEKYICQQRGRRGLLKSPPLRCLSSEDSIENGAPSIPSVRPTRRRATEGRDMAVSAGVRSRVNSQDPESFDVEIVSTPIQRRQNAKRNSESSKRRRSRIHALEDSEIEEGDKIGSGYETPVRTPRNKKRDTCGTDERRKTISEYLARASPSLSPPSKVKKRRRYRRLIVAESSEDEDHIDASGQGSKLQTGLRKRRQNSAGTAQEPQSGTPKADEWYHERDIDEFSESSCDTTPSPRHSYVTREVTRRKRRIAGGSHRTRQPLPVKRNILKSFDRSPDQGKSIGTPPTRPAALQVQRSARLLRDSAKRDRAETTRNVEAEVIDLVDDDEEPQEASNDSEESPEIDCSLDSGRGDKIDSPAFEDDAPPPFNLIALCKDGESIREMKERLGEQLVMDKVTEAQENGREIVGGEELGLTGSYNKSIFDRFSKTVVADQLGKERAAKSVTEKALRGEYKFHYRGRRKESTADKRGGAARKGNKSSGRLGKYRRKRGSS